MTFPLLDPGLLLLLLEALFSLWEIRAELKGHRRRERQAGRRRNTYRKIWLQTGHAKEEEEETYRDNTAYDS